MCVKYTVSFASIAFLPDEIGPLLSSRMIAERYSWVPMTFSDNARLFVIEGEGQNLMADLLNHTRTV